MVSIIVRIVFISSFLFYCLFLNHSFPNKPKHVYTNCFQLILFLFTTLPIYICSLRSSIFDYLKQVWIGSALHSVQKKWRRFHFSCYWYAWCRIVYNWRWKYRWTFVWTSYWYTRKIDKKSVLQIYLAFGWCCAQEISVESLYTQRDWNVGQCYQSKVRIQNCK